MKNLACTILRKNYDVWMVFLTMLAIFCYIMYFTISDLPLHAEGATRMLNENRLFNGNFLLYFLANLLTGFGLFPHVKYMFVHLLAMANTVKYTLVRDEFAKTYPKKMATSLSLALEFVFVIPFLYVFKAMGFFPDEPLYWDLMCWYFVPNVWHNSTVIFFDALRYSDLFPVCQAVRTF